MTQNGDAEKTAADIMGAMKVNIDLKIEKKDLIKYLVSEYLKPVQDKLAELTTKQIGPHNHYTKLIMQRDKRSDYLVEKIISEKEAVVRPLTLQLLEAITGQKVTAGGDKTVVTEYAHEYTTGCKGIKVILTIRTPVGESYYHYVVMTGDDAELIKLTEDIMVAQVEVNKINAEINALNAQLDPYKRQAIEQQLESQLVKNAFDGLQLPENWAQRLLPPITLAKPVSDDDGCGEDA